MTCQNNKNILNIDKNTILYLTKLPEHKIRNMYVYGSRIYGSYHANSDYDILVTGCSMSTHMEYHDGTYNVHVITPDIFYDKLINHEMMALECLFAPKEAKILSKQKYDIKIDNDVLIKKSLAQSSAAWNQARIRINDGDIDRGKKSLWHSLRILAFADQIIKHGYIHNFSEANCWLTDIFNVKSLSWINHKKKFSQFRKKLIDNIVKNVE